MEKIDRPGKETDIDIFPCTPENIDTIIQIGRYSYKQHYLHIWKDNGAFYIKRSFSREAIEKDLKIPNSRYFLIRFKGRPVGILKILRNHALVGFTASEALEVEKIYIIREAAGKGIGARVMAFVKDHARELGKKVVWLNVMNTSPALTFYKKSGFEPVYQYTLNTLDYPPIKEEYRAMTRMKFLL